MGRVGIGDGGRQAERVRRGRRQRKRRRAIAACATGAALALAVIGAGIVLAVQAAQVVDDLEAAEERLGAASALASVRDGAGLRAVVEDVSARVARADGTVSGRLWDAAARLPFVGDDIGAVRAVTQTSHDIVSAAGPACIGILDQLAAGDAISDGALDLTALRQADAALAGIQDALARAHGTLAGIDRDGLLARVDKALGRVVTAIDSAQPAAGEARETLALLGAIAGADAPRHYLVVFQNNAEIRATGGNPSALAVVGIDAGRIALEQQAAGADFYDAGTAGTAHGALEDSARALYEDDTTLYVQNYTRTPHFPTTAHWLTGLWRATTGAEVDGVVSLDPVALSYALNALGDIALPDGGVLTAENVVGYLLHDVYDLVGGDGRAADAVFAEVVEAVFARVAEGGWDPAELLSALSDAAAEQRLLAWMPREGEQDLVRAAGLDGALATGGSTSQIGVFLNDASHSKLEYDLHSAIEVQCAAGVVTTTVTLESTAPASGLNRYAIGQRNHLLGVDPAAMILDVLVFAPGAEPPVLVDPVAGDIRGWDRHGVERGRAALSIAVVVPPGGVRTVTFQTAAGDAGPVEVRHTPAATATGLVVGEGCR